jgi:two-component system, OmpR family, sensor histidine kinase CiaH
MTGDPEAALFGRLRRRLALVIALVIAAILVLLVGGILLLMDQVLVGQQADALRATALASRDELRFDASGVRLRTDPDEAGTLFLVWGPGGESLFASDPASASSFVAAAGAAVGGTGGTSQVTVSGTHGGSTTFLVDSEPIRTLTFVGVIQAARSLGPIRGAESQLTILLLAAAGAGAVLAAIAGWFLAGRSLRPVQAAFRRQREFTADASHELRTPLVVIDAGIQLLSRHPERPVATQAGTLAAMGTQTARMKRLVTDLLTLAGADAGRASVSFGEVDLDALVGTTVRSFEPLATERSASLRVGRHEGGIVSADEERLAQALGTLVDNALEHGESGSHVEVGAWREARSAVLEVRDDGPGIPPAERERVLERFARGDPARSGDGSGLGLAIARSVAVAHGGRLSLEAAVPGAARPGLLARLTLPLG